MKFIEPYVKPGISTDELDQLIHDYILTHEGVPATLGYEGFPKSSCISINEEICHGIPDNTVIKEGDLVKIDIATILNGYFGDMCKTFAVGEVSLEAKKLMHVTLTLLLESIELVKPNKRFGDIGWYIFSIAHMLGYSVVQEFCGHGVGLKFHEEPSVKHISEKGTGAKFLPGMIFTIEPMLCAGSSELLILENKWTAVTKDKKLSAQFEHTILVTEDGCKILTEF